MFILVMEHNINYGCLSTERNFNHSFELKEHFHGDVHFYYRLDGYYQNLRRYQSSRSDAQLSGDVKVGGG